MGSLRTNGEMRGNFYVKDHIAIVTSAGSERGIGRMVSLELARKGAIVVVTDLDGDGAKM